MPENTKDDKRLNPQIRETEIGVRNLRTKKVYPLSMADQLKMTDLITEALNAFFQKGDQDDIVFITFLIELIKSNLERMLGMIMDIKKDKDILSEITNFQVSEIAKIVYEENYASVAKNMEGLFKNVKNLLALERLSQTSANDIDTDLTTSTGEAGEMGEQPSDS